MITVQVEPFEPFLEEVKPILPRHYEELALDKDNIPLDPMYDLYIQRARAGQALSITVRESGKLIGYFVGFIAPGLHYRTCLTLTMDIFYVLPEHRGSAIGFKLFKAVEDECRRRGIQRMFVGSKLHKDASWLFDKLGYLEVEKYYSKTFFD